MGKTKTKQSILNNKTTNKYKREHALGNFESIDGKQTEIILKDCFLGNKSFNHAKIPTKLISRIELKD